MENQTYEKQNYIELKTSPNLKGEIGEIIAKRILWYAHRTKDNTFEYFQQRIKFIFSEQQTNFLKKYWNTIDLFRLLLKENSVENIVVFEVKTHTYYPNRSKIKHPFTALTSKTYEMLIEAQKLGFIVKIVKITFFDNWRVGMKVKEFTMKDFYIYDGGVFTPKTSTSSV